MNGLLHEIRLAFRGLARNQGFSLVVVLTLALGIGANATIFALVDSTLLKPLPFPDPDRLVAIYERSPSGENRNHVGPPNLTDWRAGSHTLEAAEGGLIAPLGLAGAGEPREAPIGLVTPGFFQVFGVTPALGRIFKTEADAQNRELVITHGFWQRQFSGQRDVLGKSVRIDSKPYTIVGVLPASFELPGWRADIWAPLVLPTGDRKDFGRFLIGFGRLRPGATVESANADLGRIASRLSTEYPNTNAGWGVNLVPLREALTGDVRSPLMLLLGAVGILLLIVCANVANLLLGRAAARSHEMAVRLALGASRGRLIRQALVESAVLAILGGGLGLLMASWSTDLLAAKASGAGELLLNGKAGIGPKVVAFTAAITMLSAFLFGMLPALVASGAGVQAALRAGARGVLGGRTRVRNALIVAEVALALVLLTGAGLLGRSLRALYEVDPGFRAEQAVAMRLTLATRDTLQQVAFADRLFERIRALPEVQATGAVSSIPIAGPLSNTGYSVEGRPQPDPAHEPEAEIRIVAGDYFRAMGIPLLRGRVFDARDRSGADRAYVIDEALAKRDFPNQDPIGHRLIVPWGDNLVGTIIGVVGPVHHVGLKEPARATIYWANAQYPMRSFDVVTRTSGSPQRLIDALRTQVHRLDPELPIAELRPVRDIVEQDVARPRFLLALLGFFAGAALLLAGIGLYGVVSYSVTQRTREIGVRMALGATPQSVVGMIVRQGMTVTAIGLVAGMIAALLAGRLVASALYGVQARDPVTLVAAGVFLLLVALLASWLPAVRAARTDPMVALRQE